MSTETQHEAAQRLCIIAQDILRRFDADGALVSPIGLPNSVEAIRLILDRLDNVQRPADAQPLPYTFNQRVWTLLHDHLGWDPQSPKDFARVRPLVDALTALCRESPQTTSQTILNTLKDGDG